MSKEKVFADGFSVFPPRDNAPEWVVGQVNIDLRKFLNWAKANEQYLVKNKEGASVLRLDVLRSQKGTFYAEVNTYNASAKVDPKEELRQHPKVQALKESLSLEDSDSLPF